jgi:hypothetical protein
VTRLFIRAATSLLAFGALNPSLNGYSIDSTIPQGGGCPSNDRQNLSISTPLNRRWSTSLPLAPTILTVAPQGTNSQISEISQAISDSFGAWSGVTGTTFNATNYPDLIAPLAQVSSANACTDDQQDDIDGLNTICFNQSSMGFATGVLAFTRVITANAPGVSVGASATSSFAGQILDADTFFRPDGQVTFATPGALATEAGQGAYDLESLLIHELGHWFGLDHSAVWRAIMFPYAPPPGQFLGNRPTAQAPDGPLSDDDRTGIRALYPDPNDATNIGSIRGQVLPANSFALAVVPSPSPGDFVTGIFGAHVVAVNVQTGSVVAGTFSGWACNTSTNSLVFDGSFDLERLPVDASYFIYAEPLVGLVAPSDFSDAFADLCASSGISQCTTPAADLNFNPRIRPPGP